jgi:DNA-binding MarR family transcriptional regulator
MLINIHQEGTAVSQIAALSGVKSTSLSRMLKSMEELGLIFRETDLNDKRSVKIFLTPFGKEKREIAKDVVRSFNEYLNTHISDKERLQFIKTLSKINQLTTDYKPQICYPESSG